MTIQLGFKPFLELRPIIRRGHWPHFIHRTRLHGKPCKLRYMNYSQWALTRGALARYLKTNRPTLRPALPVAV